MTLQAIGYQASIKLVDAAGNISYLRPDVVGADHATALTNTQSIITALDTLTNALIVGYIVSVVYAEDTEQYGTAGSEVENIAEIVCPLETAGKYHVLKVPAPVDGLFVGTTGPDRNTVDTSDADLLSYVSLYVDKTGYGTPGADAIALVSDGEKIKPDNDNDKPFVSNGKRVHRASRKG